MRINPVEEPYPQDVADSFARIMPPGVKPLRLFRVLARSKRAWQKFRAAALLEGSPLALRERELVILRVCALNQCEYEWGIHVSMFAQTAGLSADEVAATRQSPASFFSAPREHALLSMVDSLDRHSTLTTEEFQRVAAHFDEAQILEIMMLASFYRGVAYLANGLDLAPEPFAAAFPGPRTR